MTYPIPTNEAARLEQLHAYGVLDTLSEQAYDDITFLASQICESPIALISLVDEDRQWFKSSVGLDARETDRDVAFCAHAINAPGEVMQVRDATLDPRFAENPLVVADPSIRFYAGAPLVTSSGDALGTLCVIDRVPRELTPDQHQALQALSRQVMAQLESRRLAEQLELTLEERRLHTDRLDEYQKRLEHELERISEQSLTDPLTGVRNRRAFMESIDNELNRTSRSGAPTSLILLDLDHFKSVNDEFGHPAGDLALQQVARVISSELRSCDIVARYGGEEFGVILPATPSEGAAILAERLRKAIERAAWPHRAITASLGVVTSHEECAAEELLERADGALYRAKNAGRNKVEAAAA